MNRSVVEDPVKHDPKIHRMVWDRIEALWKEYGDQITTFGFNIEHSPDCAVFLIGEKELCTCNPVVMVQAYRLNSRFDLEPVGSWIG